MSTAYSTHQTYQSNGYPHSAASLPPYLNGYHQPMDGRQSDYPQSGLTSPYPPPSEPQSEGSSADQASAAQYPPDQKIHPSTFSSSATPTSEYGLNPSSARSGSFPEYLPRSYPDAAQRYQPPSAQGGNAGVMAQATSPSLSLPDGQQNNHHNAENTNSNADVPIDPSIAATGPAYPPHPYAPYSAQHDMGHYPQHPGQIYGRPDWGHHPGAYPHGIPTHYGPPPPSSAGPPQMVSPGARPPPVSVPAPAPAWVSAAAHSYPNYIYQGGHPLSTVYSFVPIPGAQQHKRPRRRYEEIERMYKCGWNGCEKAYGTLNHLNAHVTMQSHGAKRTPEEFKEIRKEWKARKKEEENQRKAEEDRQRQAAQQSQVDGASVADGSQPSSSTYPPGVRPQLPPIGYTPASGQVPPQYGPPGAGIEGMPQYGNSHMYGNYPQSPYAPNNQMYQQPPENAQTNFQQ